MPRSMLVGGVVLGLVWLTVLPRGQGQPEAPAKEPRRITITGTGSAPAVPDTARVVFAVSGEGRRVGGMDAVATAAKACDEAAEKVSAAITRLAIEGVSLKRGPLNLVPGKDDAGVEFSRTFVATIKGEGTEKLIRLADRVLLVALQAGADAKPTFNPSAATQFAGPAPTLATNERIELYCSDTSKARNEALKKAVADALANAKTLAGTAQVALKDIVTVTDQAAAPLGFLGGLLPTQRGEVQGEAEITLSVIVTAVY